MKRLAVPWFPVLLGSLALLVLGGQFLLSRQAQDLRALVEELRVQRSALNYANDQQALRVGGLKKAQTSLEEVAYRPFESAVGFYSFLDDLIDAQGLARGNVIPAAAAPGRFAVQVEVMGDYYGVMKLLAALRQGSRALRVESFSLEALSADRVRGNLTVGTLVREEERP